MELLTVTQRELARLVALQQFEAGTLTQAEIARQLRISIRQVKRLWRRYRSEGPAGVNSRRRGQPSNNRTDPALLARALELYREHYADFGPTFGSEKLLERHDLRIDHEVLRRGLIAAHMWTPSKRRRKTHPPRDRRPAFGELAQIDGSPHRWFEDRGPRCTLLVDVDDATSRLLALHFAPQETTDAYFMLVRAHIRSHGVPLAYYTDKDSVFHLTNPQSADHPTQFGRAMIELGVQLICANSPQAKGRVERANGILQNRLVKELRLRDISNIDDANDFLPEFINSYNAKFAKQPKCEVDLHRQAPKHAELDRILTHCEQRRISKNLTIQFGSDVFEILLPDQARRLAHTTVNVRRLHNGTIVIERKGQALPSRLLVTKTALPNVVGAKGIAHFPIATLKRPDHPEKAHTPAPTHPWKTLHRRPPKGDISTEFAGDITA
jgi:transposase